MRIPGRRGGAGAAALVSEAAIGAGQQEVSVGREAKVPMPLSFESPSVVALAAELEALGVGWSPTIVDVDDERLNVLARGARCVSLSSGARVRGGLQQREGRDTHSW
jgi:hypothetical protein